MRRIRYSQIKVVTTGAGEAEFYTRRGVGWSSRPKYTCVHAKVAEEFVGFLRMLGFTITRELRLFRPIHLISTELEVVCECGNRDTITAPISAMPPCSAGCGRKMKVTGAVAQ